MVEIVDHREGETTLSKFGNLPEFCVFEFPDKGGLYMKLKDGYTVRRHLERAGNHEEFTGMNVMTLRPGHILDGTWLAVEDWVKVRALNTELHILEAKKYD